MFRRSLTCLVLLQTLLLTNFSPELLAAYSSRDATTQSVVIYPDRALVKKTLQLMVNKGANTLEISGLTLSIIDDSVQAGIRNAENVRITDIEVRRTALFNVEQDRIKDVQRQIDNVVQDLVRQGNTLAVHKNSLTFLQKIVPFSQNQNTSFPAVRDYLSALEESMSAKLERIADLEQKMDVLNRKKADLEREKKNLSSLRDDSKNILISVYAERPTALDLDYSYFLRDIQWVPKYEVRADSLAQHLELNFFAMIKQSSGEDFKGVTVEISTARPALSGELPELPPWRLDLYRPPVFRSYGRAEMMDSSEAPQSAMLAAAPLKEGSGAEIKSEATSMSYLLPQKISLPSDNQPHKILISSTGCDATFSYLAVPKLAPFSSLTAELKNPLLFPLLEGELNIFLDGRFVSSRTLERPILSGDEMRLALGIDETIVASTKVQKQFTEHSGTFNKKIRKHYEYQTEIVNGKTRPITLMVRDQVPISVHAEIKVDVSAPTVKEAKIDDDGMISWIFHLAPGEKKELTTIFDISYPEDQEITGL